MTSGEFGHKGCETAAVAASQEQVDAIVDAQKATAGAIRRPLRRDPPRLPLKPSANLLDRRLEEELDYVRRLVDAAADRLADDPVILHRHATTMQSFDLIAQLLGALATVAGCEDREEAVQRVAMTDLRARLTRPVHSIIQTGTLGTLHRSRTNPFSTY